MTAHGNNFQNILLLLIEYFKTNGYRMTLTPNGFFDQASEQYPNLNQRDEFSKTFDCLWNVMSGRESKPFF